MKKSFLDYPTYITVLPNTEDSEEEQKLNINTVLAIPDSTRSESGHDY